MAASVVVAGFDGTSRLPGAAHGAETLWGALTNALQGAVVERIVVTEESKNSAFWCRKLKRTADAHVVRLTLGGEHIVSFPMLEALAPRYPNLRVVVLDAHHDAYDYPLLTHYSVFHYVRHELALPTLILGARHELDLMPPGCEVLPAARDAAWFDRALERALSFAAAGPFYLSVDLDVLDPAEFAAVSDPRPGGLSIEQLVRATGELLALGPVAVDVVEYNPLLDVRGDALRALQPFFAELGKWLV